MPALVGPLNTDADAVQAEHILHLLALKPVCSQPSPYCCRHYLPLTDMPILQSSAGSHGRSSTTVLTTVCQVHQCRHSSAGLL